MKITKTICDRCKSDKDCQSFFVETDRRIDPAGSMDSVGEHVDLCPKCMRAAVTSTLMVNQHVADHERGKAFLAWVNRR